MAISANREHSAGDTRDQQRQPAVGSPQESRPQPGGQHGKPAGALKHALSAGLHIGAGERRNPRLANAIGAAGEHAVDADQQPRRRAVGGQPQPRVGDAKNTRPMPNTPGQPMRSASSPAVAYRASKPPGRQAFWRY